MLLAGIHVRDARVLELEARVLEHTVLLRRDDPAHSRHA